MNITMSVSGDLEKWIKRFPFVKWTEIAKKAMREEAIRLKKLEIIEKYLEGKKLTKEDIEFMEEIDWHPVDEMEIKPDFAKSLKEASKGKTKKISL